MNHEMFIAGSNYWNMAYGQMPGDMEQDEEGMNNMRNLVQNMASSESIELKFGVQAFGGIIVLYPAPNRKL